jgi:hypothetical protein
VIRSDRRYGTKIFFFERLPRGALDLSLDHTNDVKGTWEDLLISSKKCPQSALDPIPLDSTSNFFAHDNSHPGKVQIIGEVDEVEISASITIAFFIQKYKIFLFRYPLLRSQSFGHQPASLFLPFCLLFLMMRWPAFVRMRTRKPWFFFLFLLLGWNVRFIVFSVFLCVY